GAGRWWWAGAAAGTFHYPPAGARPEGRFARARPRARRAGDPRRGIPPESTWPARSRPGIITGERGFPVPRSTAPGLARRPVANRIAPAMNDSPANEARPQGI